MPSNKKLLQAAAGSAGGDNLYVEDVFSTFLYTGDGSAETITTGIDMLGEGGLVWNKNRSSAVANLLVDSERGSVGKYLSSDSVAAQATITGNSFTNTGYVLGTDMGSISGDNYVSWSFRKAKGFCDIVTYTGNGTAGRTVAHSLGSAPKLVLVKRTNTSNNWICWHTSLANNKYIQLNSTSPAYDDGGIFWNNTTPDATNLTLGNDSGVNGSGSTYVAYLFGEDAIFGEDGDEQICKMGSYTGNGTVGRTVDFGFEPQWVLIKSSSTTDDWYLFDSMREWTQDISARLRPNTTDEANRAFYYSPPNATGITFNASSGGALNANGTEYIYMAIRRPMKVPEAGTEVYGGVSFAGNNATNRFHNLGVQVDLALSYNTNGFVGFTNRLLGGGSLYMPSTAGDANAYWSLPDWYALDFMNGYMSKTSYSYSNSANTSFYTLGFKTATGFLSVLAWSGQSNASYAVPHSLGVKPEIIIYKRRSSTVAPYIAETLTNKSGDFEAGNALTSSRFNTDFASTSPTNTQITVSNAVANTGDDLLAFLFASVSGVSKCGTFTGTGSSLDIDCGFSNGARFILIKRIDNSGGAYLFDYKQGITSGNSSYIVMNTNTAPVTNTDFVDPLSSGFNLTANGTSTVNISGATYLFLAIA